MIKTIFLDNAAATPMDELVYESIKPYFIDKFYNPSAIDQHSRQVRHEMDSARHEVSGIIGCRPSEVIFTSGGTESNNLAITGVLKQFKNVNIITSQIEHDSVLVPASQFNHKKVAVDKSGFVDINELSKLITPETVLVSIGMVNSEIGTIQPLREISEIINKERISRKNKGVKTPIYFHSDACQAANYFEINAKNLGLDLMSLNGGKIYGPKQSGVLFVKTGTQINPIILGGGHEFGIRSGTENVAFAVGFSKALQLTQLRRKDEVQRLKLLQDQFINYLKATLKEQIIINGSLKRRSPNNISVTFLGQDNERLLFELDERGVICATGSACSASKEGPSHVLKAIGLSDESAQSTLRFSLGRQTNSSDVELVCKILKDLIK